MPETLRPPIDPQLRKMLAAAKPSTAEIYRTLDAQLQDIRQDITKMMLRAGVAISDSRRGILAIVAKNTFNLTKLIVELAARIRDLEERP